MSKIKELEGAMQALKDHEHFDRLIEMIKLSLREYPTLKTEYETGTDERKKESLLATRFLVDAINQEFLTVGRATGLQTEQIFARLYQSDRLTPMECQLFLQARATITQYGNEIFSEKAEAPKKKKPKRPRLRI